MLAASTFNFGLLLLPGELRSDARRLYCILRALDDLVDESDPHADQRIAAVEEWTSESCRITKTPETRVLEYLDERYPLPRDAVSEFCLGMRHDLVNATIETEDDLESYCEHVAGTVGVMLTAMFGSSHRSAAHDMATLGRAMQRTNILRDIDEDLEHGRVYIARTTIERFGHPVPGQRERLLRDQIARADALYDEGRVAIESLLHGREAMALSIALYQEILRQIECDGYGRRAGRASVPEWRRREIAHPYTSDSATS